MSPQAFRAEQVHGNLIPAEFIKLCNKLGMDGAAHGARLFAAFDIDGDGFLDFRETFIG